MLLKRAIRVTSLLAFVSLVFLQLELKASAADSKVPAKIQAVLDAQLVAWNRGDVEGFMDGYKRSDDLVYIGNKTVVKGWQALLDSYRTRFKKPGGVEMGVLRLAEENITILDRDSAVIWGTFDVTTANGKRRGGAYTLVMHNEPAGWRTVYDRTSTEDL